MIHLDLFSGIGGFAYAADQVFGDVEHIFVDNNKFCQQVLKKHWPEAKIYGDIKEITNPGKADIVTGGFPCQPFSQAGKRKGTDDNRYLWPEMLRIIRLTKPEWVIAENVSGLINWNDGMVLETVCVDLEAAGYEVQPVIIPALAVNAPHRRERVWFIAHAKHYGRNKAETIEKNSRPQSQSQTREKLSVDELARASSIRSSESGRDRWNRNWTDIAAELCRVDNGLPNRVDRIKALGNSIVPQVAMEIMQGML